MPRIAIGIVVTALMGALTVSHATLAHAHAAVVDQQPSPGAALTAAPTQLLLHLNEPALANGARFKLVGPSGDLPLTPAANGTDIAVALPPALPAGTYTWSWRVSSADGHIITGTSAFTVRLPASSGPVTTAEPQVTTGDTLGTPTSRPGDTHRPNPAPVEQHETRTTQRTILVVAFIVLALALIGWLLWRRRRTLPPATTAPQPATNTTVAGAPTHPQDSEQTN